MAGSTQIRPVSQERALVTRVGLLESVIECLTQTGYASTTIRAVAERAGTSAGAVQHHFGSRDQMVTATMAYLFEKFVGRLQSLDGQALQAEGPVALATKIVATLWDFYGGELNTAVMEIVVGARTHPALHLAIEATRQDIVAAYLAPWKDLMAHTALSPEHQVDLMQFAIATVRGLALARVYSQQDPRFFVRELSVLQGVLAQAISTGVLPDAQTPACHRPMS